MEQPPLKVGFLEFYKELEAEMFGASAQSWSYNFFNWSSDWGRILLGGFYLVYLMVLEQVGSPPCGCGG
ncbi:hypothetical protein Tco_1080362 [Tanacetum coccineum]|uniref:Uncharacterized protein n=1 Tax=Tanacetum coccineum TaxID=301880 RepID=A0ABQ5HUH9_9ASTR